MSYNPHTTELDFEIGSIGGALKKGWKGATKVLNKVTDYTITKPSAFIGKTIGGKKGEAIGRKLGSFTSTVTKLGVGAGAAGLAPALLPAIGTPLAVAAGVKRLRKKKRSPKISRASKARLDAHHNNVRRKGSPLMRRKSKPCSANNALAARVATLLVAKLGGPLGKANKALNLANLQRTATYEHKKLMSNAEFRKKVLAGITAMADSGNANCQRTIRVLVGR